MKWLILLLFPVIVFSQDTIPAIPLQPLIKSSPVFKPVQADRYVLLLNFFGKGNKTLIPKTIKNKNNMNNKINDISGFSSPIKLIIKDDINIKAKDINPYLALKA